MAVVSTTKVFIPDDKLSAELKTYLDCCVAYALSRKDQHLDCTSAGDMVNNLYGNYCDAVPEEAYVYQLALQCIKAHSEVTYQDYYAQYKDVAIIKPTVFPSETDWFAEWERRVIIHHELGEAIERWVEQHVKGHNA